MNIPVLIFDPPYQRSIRRRRRARAIRRYAMYAVGGAMFGGYIVSILYAAYIFFGE